MADDLILDVETKAIEAPDAHKQELRLWLRLLACATTIEREIRTRLREEFDTTLPRFDLLAQLERAPQGMTLGEVSRRMMVSNGNITGLVERLVEDKLVTRTPLASDRRVQIIVLTPTGRREFGRMAGAHEGWVAEMVGDLPPDEIDVLIERLGALKQSVHRSIREQDA
jgi:DNA-binding MarR family transcriptional regulator